MSDEKKEIELEEIFKEQADYKKFKHFRNILLNDLYEEYMKAREAGDYEKMRSIRREILQFEELYGIAEFHKSEIIKELEETKKQTKDNKVIYKIGKGEGEEKTIISLIKEDEDVILEM
ncbi:MAG: hypothetical protein N2254_09815 [bacterium]|nr:hypothetical protein [bacterium]